MILAIIDVVADKRTLGLLLFTTLSSFNVVMLGKPPCKNKFFLPIGTGISNECLCC